MDQNQKVGSVAHKCLSASIIFLLCLYVFGAIIIREKVSVFIIPLGVTFLILAILYFITVARSFKKFNFTDKILFPVITVLLIFILYVGIQGSIAVCVLAKLCPQSVNPIHEEDLQKMMYKENPWLDPSSPQYIRGPNGR